MRPPFAYVFDAYPCPGWAVRVNSGTGIGVKGVA